MLYTQPATSLKPALVIYLIDASHSMNDPCGTTTKIDMVRRSMRDGIVQRRYKMAIFAYSTKVVDALDGICDLPDVVKHGVPVISAGGETDTTAGFSAVEKLLQAHLEEFRSCPAPLV